MNPATRRKTRQKHLTGKTTRPSKKTALPQAQDGVGIKFESFEDHADHVTGIAIVQDPQGSDRFKVLISAQDRAALKELEKEFRFIRLQLATPQSAQRQLLSQRDAVGYWRQVWRKRLSELRQFVGECNDPVSLAIPDRVWQTYRDQERARNGHRTKLDWSHDHLIQILPLDHPKDSGPYRLSFTIDPPIAPFGGRSFELDRPGNWNLNSTSMPSIVASEGWISDGTNTFYGVTVNETAGRNGYYSITVNGRSFT